MLAAFAVSAFAAIQVVLASWWIAPAPWLPQPRRQQRQRLLVSG